MPLPYRPRLVDDQLVRQLQATGAVLIEGPRACGKTETARQRARSEVRLDVDSTARAAASVSPDLVIAGERPRLIDEWQVVPEIWDHVRRAVDDAGGKAGQFILTGSAVPADDAARHTGALRFSRLRMRPMCLFESGHSTGAVSLSELLSGAPVGASDSGLDLVAIAERIAVGGWPALLDRSVGQAQTALRGYVEDTCRIDVSRIDGVRRDPEKVMRLLRSLARHVSTQASATSIAADVGGSAGPIKPHTAIEYMNVLSRLHVLEDLPAWAPAIRSRSPLRSAPTHHFTDPSIALAAMNISPDKLIREVESLGLLFESLVVRDLRVLAQPLGGLVAHYRDQTGLEVDAVVELPDGRWSAFEVKLGQRAVDAAADGLLRLAQRIDQERHGPPVALAVITATGYAYRRPDGVHVVPIGTLGP